MTREEEGQDKEKERLDVIAWCYRHCRLDRQSLDRQSEGGEMPDRGRA